MNEVMYEFHRMNGIDGSSGGTSFGSKQKSDQQNICMRRWGMASVNGVSYAKHAMRFTVCTCEIGGHIEDRELWSISKCMEILKGMEGIGSHYTARAIRKFTDGGVVWRAT